MGVFGQMYAEFMSTGRYMNAERFADDARQHSIIFNSKTNHG